MPEIEIRSLTTVAEMQEIEELERAVWGMSDAELISVHTLHAMQHSGGQVVGAYDEGRLVGFAVCILGTLADPDRIDQVAAARLKLYSVIAGVLPAYQNQGVGYRLKLAQRQFALELGVRMIAWTYDPLQSLNGRFNIGKLGAVCHTYHRDFHGPMSGINAGAPSDRFEVNWWVTSNRVQSRATQQRRPLSLTALIGGGAVLVNEATFNRQGLPTPPLNYVSRPSNLMLVEIPAHFQAIKQQDVDLAIRWRQHTRILFEELFHSGFVVTDFVSEEIPPGRRRSFYLLTHRDA